MEPPRRPGRGLRSSDDRESAPSAIEARVEIRRVALRARPRFRRKRPATRGDRELLGIELTVAGEAFDVATELLAGAEWNHRVQPHHASDLDQGALLV